MRLSYRAVLVASTVVGAVVGAVGGLPVAAAASSSRPVITAMSPASGPTAGGTVAVLHGHNLTHVTGVYFGREPARFRSVSPTVLRAAAPTTYTTHHSTVRVVTRAGTSNPRTFLYVARPTVTSFAPTVGSVRGGTRVTVHGTDFRSVEAVSIGGVRGTSVRVTSTRTLTVVTPAHRVEVSPIVLRVRTAYGTSSDLDTDDRFDFGVDPVVQRLDPADGPTTGGRQVTLTGPGLNRARAVTFGGKAATVLNRYSSSIEVEAPAHAVGYVDVVVRTDIGTSPVTAATRFRYGPANPLRWSAPTVVDPVRSGLDELSCSGTLCAAIGRDGGVYGNDGTGWREADPLSTQPWDAVFCSAASFCSATSERGWESHYVDGAWSTPSRSWSGAARAMVCTSSTSCLGFSTIGQEMDWDGTVWTASTTRVQNVVALTCTAPTDCVAVTSDGSAPTRTGDFWTFGAHAAPTVLSAAACDPSGGCLVADRNGQWFAHDAGTSGWHAVDAGPTPAGIVGHNLSCASPTFCVLTSRNAQGDPVFVALRDGTWQPAVAAPAGLNVLPSCGAVGRCTFARFTRTNALVQTFDGTSYGDGESVDTYRGSLVDVSCSSDTFCAAVDSAGNAVVSGPDGSWSRPARVADELQKVSCGEDGHCVAIGRYAIHQLDAGAWTTVVEQTGTEFLDVSCVGSSYCVVVDAAGNARELRDGGWRAPVQVASAALSAVSCSGVGRCSAVAGPRSVVSMSNGTWGTARTVATDGPTLNSIECLPSLNCFVGRSDGSVFRVRGTDIASYGKLLPGDVRELSCSAEAYCVATDGVSGADVTWDGSSWSATGTVGTHATRGVSCTARRCVAVDESSVYTAAR